MESVWEQTEEHKPKPNGSVEEVAEPDTSLHIAELAALPPPKCIVDGLYAPLVHQRWRLGRL